jgi:rapamycin-insensitive companion of mTOR
MSNAPMNSPKAYPAPARVRGGSGSSGHLAAPRLANNGTGTSSSGVGNTGGDLAGTGNPNGPGGFSSSLRSATTAVMTPHTTTVMTPYATTVMTPHAIAGDFSTPISPASSETLVEELTDQLNRAIKYKEGAENLLQVLDSRKVKEAKKARNEAEKEYNARNQEITQLQNQIAAIKRPRETPAIARSARAFQGEPVAPISNGLAINGTPDLPGSESPTLSLTDLLRDLEEKGNRNEYYVEKANHLVLLFKRHPNLKYELNWSTFGHRLHSMLLHESREVIAAGYRVTRYALTDVQSLKTIRSLHIDHLAILSLASKSNVEREQALKFARAFLEISGGVVEISRAMVRAIVACAEQPDDRLRGIAMETLAEILVLDPALVVSAGGVRVLTQVLGDGPWEIADALSLAFLYLLDMPHTRKYVRAGHDLEV